jgi:hypothetical protein
VDPGDRRARRSPGRGRGRRTTPKESSGGGGNAKGAPCASDAPRARLRATAGRRSWITPGNAGGAHSRHGRGFELQLAAARGSLPATPVGVGGSTPAPRARLRATAGRRSCGRCPGVRGRHDRTPSARCVLAPRTATRQRPARRARHRATAVGAMPRREAARGVRAAATRASARPNAWVLPVIARAGTAGSGAVRVRHRATAAGAMPRRGSARSVRAAATRA